MIVRIVRIVLIVLNKLFNKNETLQRSFYDGKILRLVTIILRFYSIFIFPKKQFFKIRTLSTDTVFKLFLSIKNEYKFKYPTYLWRVFGIYEPYTSLAIKKFCNNDDIFLELGAAYGYFTMQISKICREVHSCEPNGESISYLKKSIEINNIKNVKAYQCAIGDENKKITIHGKVTNQINLKNFLSINNISPTFIFIDCDADDNCLAMGILKMVFEEFKEKKIKIICETREHKLFKSLMEKNSQYTYKKFSSMHYFVNSHENIN